MRFPGAHDGPGAGVPHRGERDRLVGQGEGGRAEGGRDARGQRAGRERHRVPDTGAPDGPRHAREGGRGRAEGRRGAHAEAHRRGQRGRDGVHHARDAALRAAPHDAVDVADARDDESRRRLVLRFLRADGSSARRFAGIGA